MYLNQGSKEKSKTAYLHALEIDMYCVEALKALIDNFMLDFREERMILAALGTTYESTFLRCIYTCLLSKV